MPLATSSGILACTCRYHCPLRWLSQPNPARGAGRTRGAVPEQRRRATEHSAQVQMHAPTDPLPAARPPASPSMQMVSATGSWGGRGRRCAAAAGSTANGAPPGGAPSGAACAGPAPLSTTAALRGAVGGLRVWRAAAVALQGLVAAPIGAVTARQQSVMAAICVVSRARGGGQMPCGAQTPHVSDMVARPLPFAELTEPCINRIPVPAHHPRWRSRGPGCCRRQWRSCAPPAPCLRCSMDWGVHRRAGSRPPPAFLMASRHCCPPPRQPACSPPGASQPPAF